MPETVGIREAKAQLSRLVRQAQRGDSITLTHRGRPIAKIVPIAEPDRSAAARIHFICDLRQLKLKKKLFLNLD